jgi:hypothetical protein
MSLKPVVMMAWMMRLQYVYDPYGQRNVYARLLLPHWDRLSRSHGYWIVALLLILLLNTEKGVVGVTGPNVDSTLDAMNEITKIFQDVSTIQRGIIGSSSFLLSCIGNPR